MRRFRLLARGSERMDETPLSHRDRDPLSAAPIKIPSDRVFLAGLIVLGGVYLALIVLMILADLAHTDRESLVNALRSPEIRYALFLSLISCTLATVLSLWVSVPIGYLMSRFQFRGKSLVDAVLDIPIVLPPMVVGVSLLILFQFPPFSFVASAVVYEIPAVVLAQFTVAAAFAVRTMRVTFDQISPRYEAVAMTLGCSRKAAFWTVVFPQARKGMFAAGALAWARSMGEFGPILVFAGSTRLKTEVLSTSVYLELQAGNLEGMLAVSLLMVAVSATVLIVVRLFGMPRLNA